MDYLNIVLEWVQYSDHDLDIRSFDYWTDLDHLNIGQVRNLDSHFTLDSVQSSC